VWKSTVSKDVDHTVAHLLCRVEVLSVLGSQADLEARALPSFEKALRDFEEVGGFTRCPPFAVTAINQSTGLDVSSRCLGET